MAVPIVDREKCSGCGLCVSVCRCGILEVVDGVVVVRERKGCDRCLNWCALCESVCPTGAISYPFEIVLNET